MASKTFFVDDIVYLQTPNTVPFRVLRHSAKGFIIQGPSGNTFDVTTDEIASVPFKSVADAQTDLQRLPEYATYRVALNGYFSLPVAERSDEHLETVMMLFRAWRKKIGK